MPSLKNFFAKRAARYDSLISSASQLHYRIFLGLLFLASMFHQLEDWSDRTGAIVTCLTIFLGLLFRRAEKFIFLSYLLFALWVYANKFPNLANHSNFNFFLFILIIPFHLKFISTSFKALKNGLNIGLNTDGLIQSIRISAILLYFFTFFHKLNWGFLDPEISCANDKLEDYYRYIPEVFNFSLSYFKSISPYLALTIEGLIPFCLIFGRLRKFGIFLVILLHSTLAPLGFTDFSSLGMALAWSFTDPDKLNTSSLWKRFSLLAFACLLFELCFAPFRYPLGRESHEMLEAFIFLALYFTFFYSVGFKSIDTSFIKLPKSIFYKFCLLLLLIFGSSNYLGLRTAGTFSMFSNLRTEGFDSNHILLKSNPLKVFNFQEDAIEIIKVSRFASGFYRNMPVKGQIIPRVEFARILEKLKRFKAVSMVVRYDGILYKTKDAGLDPEFNFDVPWWQKKLFKFRAIPSKHPKLCSW